MNLTPVTPRKSLNKAFLKQKPLRSEIELFKTNLIRLLNKIDEIEREENQKNHIRDFLRDTFYKETNEINTKDTKDLVIHLGKSNKDKVGVGIKAKKQGQDTLALEHQVDELVYGLFRITEEERMVIEGGIKGIYFDTKQF